MSKNPLAKHFALLRTSDMILMNYKGEPIGGETFGSYTPCEQLLIRHDPGNRSRPANAAGFLIHAPVHKYRPDIIVACHTHSPHGMAWSSFARPLEMLT